jgi:hypothetical protein
MLSIGSYHILETLHVTASHESIPSRRCCDKGAR